MPRPRIAVDMDETIADTAAAQRAWLTERFGYVWPDDLGAGRQLGELISPTHNAALEEMMRAGDFFADLPVMAGAVEALAALSERYDVFVTSAAMEYPMSMTAKFRWLRRHFDFLDPLKFVFCGDKSVIRADVLIDDNARHFCHFAGRGVLYSAPHNRAVTAFARLEDWSGAQSLLAGVLSASG